jgi:hypothetical protein
LGSEPALLDRIFGSLGKCTVDARYLLLQVSWLAGIDWKLAAAEARLASLDRKLARLIWAVVINAAATMTMLVKHW